jgi:iron complex outermembrane receptor protein
VDARALRRYSFTAGVREEVYGSGQTQLSPTVAAGVWLTPTLKFRASASRAFRLPTFTDLYYHDPANVGSPDLRPEKAWSYEGGLQWSPSRRFRAEGNVFQRRERDGIDYVRATSSDIWRATNFQRLRFTGVETGIAWTPVDGHLIEARFTGLAGVQEVVAGLQSKYAFNYPSRNFAATYTATLPAGIVARTQIGALRREGRDPYALWDVSAGYARGRVRPFVQAANITSTQYQEVAGVAMPGRSILGGVEFIILGAR